VDLKQLEYFVRVAEIGSITKAAALLHVAQPALSRQIAQLESELKVQLLTRNGRGVIPTSAGKKLLAHGRGILRQVELARDEVSAKQGNAEGLIVVGVPASVAATLTVPMIEAFRAEMPNVEVSVLQGRSSSLLEWLVSGRIDMALLYDPPYSPLVKSTPLLTEKLALIQGQDSDGQSPIDLSLIPEYPLIIPSRPNTMRLLIETQLMRIGLKPAIAFEVDNVTNILELVAKGYGSAILSPRAASSAPSKLRLNIRPIVRPSLTVRLSLSTSARSPHNPLRDHAIKIVETISRKMIAGSLNTSLKSAKLKRSSARKIM
jgi:LysR family nitrogen assimilation transcriptional regulator